MSKLCLVATVLSIAVFAGSAHAVPVSFTKLTGLTGGSVQGTAVYQADLSGIGFSSAQAVSIQDSNSGVGGATGQFSGFDLDAIILSNTNCATAACAQGLAGIPVFNYLSAIFTPGTQRPVADLKLFGTGVGGNTVDNAVVTLGAFDAESLSVVPGADGFISLGDGGSLVFNLTSSVLTAGLFLYIGEVGDNGEVASGDIQVFDRPVGVPEPASLGLLALALVGFGLLRRKRTA